MNKEELHDRAALYAIGALPDGEAAVFERELKDNYELQEMAHEWQRFNELDALQCPEQAPPFQSYTRIMRAIDEAGSVPAQATEPARRPRALTWLSWSGWAVAACAALAFGLSERNAAPKGAGLGDMVLTELGRPGASRTIASSETGANLDDRMVELADLAEAYWYSRASENSPEAAGFSIFDPKLKIGFIAVENLPEGQDGMSYHVWAKSPSGSGPVRAGTLPIGRQSSGLFYFDLSTNQEIGTAGSAVSFFVTEESSASPVSPKGAVVLGL